MQAGPEIKDQLLGRLMLGRNKYIPMISMSSTSKKIFLPTGRHSIDVHRYLRRGPSQIPHRFVSPSSPLDSHAQRASQHTGVGPVKKKITAKCQVLNIRFRFMRNLIPKHWHHDRASR